MVGTCPICSQSFSLKAKNQKYCSPRCRAKVWAHVKTFVPIPRDCAICQQTFLPVVANQKYCGVQCQQEAHKYVPKEQPPEARSCPICSANFTAKQSSNVKYCSPECCKLSNPYLVKEPSEQTCPICDGAFLTRKGVTGQIYCSKECRLLNAARQHEEKKNEAFLSSIRSKYHTTDNFDIWFNNESEFHRWFESSYFMFGIRRLIKSDRMFPDVVAELFDGRILNIELEYHCNNFKTHEHYSFHCDLIVSYLKAEKQTHVRSVPVLAIFNASDHHTGTCSWNYNSRQLTDQFRHLCQQQSAMLYALSTAKPLESVS
jgi:hypothetical protein